MKTIAVTVGLVAALLLTCVSAQATDHKKDDKKPEIKKPTPAPQKGPPRGPSFPGPRPDGPHRGPFGPGMPGRGGPGWGHPPGPHHPPQHGPGGCKSDCCHDAHIVVNLDPRPCYTENGLNTFMAIFARAAEKGVENATIRAMNAAKVCPDCDEKPGPK